MKSLFSIFTLLMLSLGAYAAATDVHLRVAVHGEDGLPVSGATVQGYFTNLRYDYQSGPERLSLTNDEGSAGISGPALISVNVEVSKEGYYKSAQQVVVNQVRGQSSSILLREKRNPIAMYAKKILLSARNGRRQGEQFGYDLLVGDFVAPYGKGVVSDFLVTHTYGRQDVWNYTFRILIEFSNPEDGILPFYFDQDVSEYKSAYIAPDAGYLNHWELTGERRGVGKEEVGSRDIRRNYFFRVRTKKNNDGEIVSALYGKIYGELPNITYYLNPSFNDRNMEFDVKKNLFKNLDVDEGVSLP